MLVIVSAGTSKGGGVRMLLDHLSISAKEIELQLSKLNRDLSLEVTMSKRIPLVGDELKAYEEEQERIKKEEALKATLSKEEEQKASHGVDANVGDPMVIDATSPVFHLMVMGENQLTASLTGHCVIFIQSLPFHQFSQRIASAVTPQDAGKSEGLHSDRTL